MKVIIRRPKIKEKQKIHALFDAVIRHTFELEDVGDEMELVKELIADQQALIDTDFDPNGEQVCFLVAQCGKKIVGTICHRPCSDIILDCANRDATGMQEIGSVYVLPEFQGKGIAKLLLNAMYIMMMGKGFDAFWLDSGYAIAKQVWQRILGNPTVIMKDYWAQGVDHHIWFRKLDEVSIEYKA